MNTETEEIITAVSNEITYAFEQVQDAVSGFVSIPYLSEADYEVVSAKLTQLENEVYKLVNRE